MGYLLQQIFWYCLISFLLGLLAGWWMARAAGSRLVHELEERIRGLQGEADGLKRELRDLRVRLAECEAEAERAEKRADAAAAVMADEAVRAEKEHLRADAEAHRADAEALRAEIDEVTLEATEEALAEAHAKGGKAHDHSTPVEAIEGIGTGYGSRLRAVGIGSVEKLLEACATDEGVERVREATDEDTHVVHTWAIMADLMRIQGLGGQWAELLWRSGVTSVQDLATREAEALLEHMNEVNVEEHRVRELPGPQRLVDFIAEAGGLPRAIPDRPGLSTE